jgi:coproporphyrinogen III oxidase-like Fe-S oxidoreductase
MRNQLETYVTQLENMEMTNNERQLEKIEEIRSILIQAIVANNGFHAVKNIRAWAAEENKEIKQHVDELLNAACEKLARI